MKIKLDDFIMWLSLVVVSFVIASLIGTARADEFTPDIRPFDDHKIVVRVSGRWMEQRGESCHLGTDYALNYGTSVNATADGTVIWAKMCRGYGLLMIVDHGNGYQTYYAHLSETKYLAGARVKKGEVIACSGDSGGVPAHLHYSVRTKEGFINPWTVLSSNARRTYAVVVRSK